MFRQQDYILRVIEQAARFLVELRNLILGKEVSSDEAGTQLRKIADQAGIDFDLMRTVSDDTLVMLMSPLGEPEPGRTWITAELFYTDGLQAELEEQDEEAREAFSKALLLYTLLDPGIIVRGMPEARKRIEELKARLVEQSSIEPIPDSD